ncbi:hypothetical protein [Streptomyces clavuligerus]|uniref:hypothetical protein n=1 Tax=Streptomyces clavuligerus TaxID=1901 RepID=UPI00020D930F|nr:hypothetical protein [Streptomyces clavuligerus]WDN53657.1 transporter [Streptomyces clavuligerus]
MRRALLLSVAVTSLWGALDEYVPLLAAGTGVATGTVPFLVLAVWAGVTLGGLLAGRAERLPGRALAVLLLAAGVLLAAGALGRSAAGFALLAGAFLVFQLLDVVADARLQAAIEGPAARATVTSLAGFGSSAGTLLVYGVYGAASGAGLDHGSVFALFAVVCPVIAVLLLGVAAPAGTPVPTVPTVPEGTTPAGPSAAAGPGGTAGTS